MLWGSWNDDVSWFLCAFLLWKPSFSSPNDASWSIKGHFRSSFVWKYAWKFQVEIQIQEMQIPVLVPVSNRYEIGRDNCVVSSELGR